MRETKGLPPRRHPAAPSTLKAPAVRDTVFEAGGWRVEHLRQELDGAAVSDLEERCADYTFMFTGEPPERDGGAEFFAAMPEGRALDDMLKLGVRDRTGTLVGLIDVARDYPQPGTWYVGLLLMDPTIRTKGIGGAVVQALKQEAGRNGAINIKLAVVQENTRALKFWRAQGFAVERELPAKRFGTKDHVRLELTVDLPSDRIRPA
jgi:RimJ/RimL family protein N-acetyltransferase